LKTRRFRNDVGDSVRARRAAGRSCVDGSGIRRGDGSRALAAPPTPDDRWAARLWAEVAPEFAGAIGVRPGPAGSIIAAWSLERADAVAMVAEIALALPRRLSREIRENTELRGGIALGGVNVGASSDAVERCAERLALVARSLMGMPVPANRRLAWAVERLAAASTDDPRRARRS
jgi:hypothetical protein